MRLIAKCGNGHAEVVSIMGVGRAYAQSLATILNDTLRFQGCGLCGDREGVVSLAGFTPGERVRVKATGRIGRVRDVTPDRVIVEVKLGERPSPLDGVSMRRTEVHSLDEDDVELMSGAFEVGSLVRVDDDRVGRVTERHGIAHVVTFEDGERAFVDGAMLSQEL